MTAPKPMSALEFAAQWNRATAVNDLEMLDVLKELRQCREALRFVKSDPCYSALCSVTHDEIDACLLPREDA